ncbi:hypothetical protein [Runella slithyformis]|uniref:Uncharacterized protein n=1 Tax=Runella slithyformis (strain ATCC 29530 / DSM 19594 / LMG 11500 / NCIMB 11436 / LSU 4) TaxID=761193 RepID=A0A7U4E3X4_RUNSL|nr:hypothetical protein [Runella slithyformis]AEI46848.1 hypothetical protein Runsl_0396 [Runella slithyformis DSM 19594]
MNLFDRLFQHRFVVRTLCLLPLLLYVLFFQSIALNVNYVAYDDIHVLQIIEQWQQASRWQDKLDWLTVGFPEHRIVFTRFMVLLSYWLTGQVNLKTLMVISNTLWIGQLGILYLIFKKIASASQERFLSFAYFIPLCWILLSVQSFENICWGTSSLGNFGLLFFVMLAGYFYTCFPRTSRLFPALLFSFFATFTYGNGLVTFLIGGFVLVLIRRWKAAGITAGAFAATMLLYGLTRAHASPRGLNLTDPSSYGHALTCFFAFIGSSVNVDVYAPSTVAVWGSVVWGAVLLTGIVLILWKAIRLKNFGSKIRHFEVVINLSEVQLFSLFLLLFVGLTALGVVYKRAESDGLIGMFKGRYRMYPTWLLVVGYLLLIHWLRDTQKWLLPLTVGLSAMFNLLILYYAVAPAVNNRRAAVVQEFNSMYNEDLLGLKMFDMKGKDFKRIQRLYQPDLFFEATPQTAIAKEPFPLDSVYFSGDILHITYKKGFILPTQNFDDGAYVMLQSLSHTYMAAGMQQALPLKTFIRRGRYWDLGFTATFHRAPIVAGTYDILVLLRENGVNKQYDTGRKITFRDLFMR